VLLAILVFGGGALLLTRGGESAVSATLPRGSAEAKSNGEVSAPAASKELQRSPATLETKEESPRLPADSRDSVLILLFASCSHAPTAVQLVSQGERLAATAVDERTWSLPWLAATRADASVEIEFRANVRILLSEIQRSQIDVAIPRLGEITASFRDVDAVWTAEWTPEKEDGMGWGKIDSPLAIVGATATLQLRCGGHQMASGLDRDALLAPIGSAWEVGVSSPGFQLDPWGREHVKVPADLEFTGHRLTGVRIVGQLPLGTHLLVYEKKDMSRNCIWAQVEDARAESTLIHHRWAPLASNAPHQLECLTPDGQRASTDFETDAVGAAEVVVAGLRFDPPTIIPLGAGQTLHRLYLRTDRYWRTVATEPHEFSPTAGRLVFTDTEARVLRVTHSSTPWFEGFLVTKQGTIARLLPASADPIVPQWFEGTSRRVRLEQLPRTTSMAAWSLSFAANDADGQTIWLEICSGEGAVSKLQDTIFWDMPALRMKLWTIARDGDGKGTQSELESPFR